MLSKKQQFYRHVCFFFIILTWHQALTLIRDLAALGFERRDDDGAWVSVVAVVQYGGLCVVAVVVVVVGGA